MSDTYIYVTSSIHGNVHTCTHMHACDTGTATQTRVHTKSLIKEHYQQGYVHTKLTGRNHLIRLFNIYDRNSYLRWECNSGGHWHVGSFTVRSRWEDMYSYPGSGNVKHGTRRIPGYSSMHSYSLASQIGVDVRRHMYTYCS